MSAAEIADNKWELQSTRPQTTSPGGIAQIVIMGGFALFFLWIVASSAIAIVTPKSDDGNWTNEIGKKPGAGGSASDAAK